jgi:hypothetical protein
MLMLAYYEKPAKGQPSSLSPAATTVPRDSSVPINSAGHNAPVPIIGAPACVFYEHTTALDVLLPRLMADDLISREELASLGEGGLLSL